MDSGKLKELAGQFIRFGLVGIINTVLTLAIIFATVEVLGIYYITGNAAGYIAGFINSFIMNKLWTFKSSGPVMRESILFIIVFGGCYFAQLIILMVLKERIGIDAFYSQVLAMVPYTVLNFLGNRYITFKGRREK